MAQVYGGDVLESRKRKLSDGGQRSLLDREFPESGQAAEGEWLDDGYVVAVQGEFSQGAQTGESVAFDDGEVVSGEG